jgi:hypothetical protein
MDPLADSSLRGADDSAQTASAESAAAAGDAARVAPGATFALAVNVLVEAALSGSRLVPSLFIAEAEEP